MAGVRRTWDKQFYEDKAKERLENGDNFEIDKTKISTKKYLKEEFQSAAEDAAGPMGSERAFLKARREKIDVDSKVGKTEIIDPNKADQAGGAGYWCEVCACLLKDSISYLDHINGKKHLRMLGFSMRVERADVTKVKERLTNLKRNIDESVNNKVISALDSYDARIADQVAQEEIRKKRKQNEKAKKDEKIIAEIEYADPVIAALMGFGGFTKGKKN